MSESVSQDKSLDELMQEAGISKEKRQRVVSKIGDQQSHDIVTAGVHQEVYYSGPLPPPDLLDKFNKVIPNGAARIMDLTEKQSSHRQFIEKIVIFSQQMQSWTGQFCALIVAISGFYFASKCVNPAVGGVMAGGTIVALVSAFLGGRYFQKKNLEQKK